MSVKETGVEGKELRNEEMMWWETERGRIKAQVVLKDEKQEKSNIK